MISDDDYQQWLRDSSADRVILVEADYYGGTVYLSSAPFVSLPTDTPQNIPYRAVISQDVVFSESISQSLSLGALSLVNGGELDHWLGRLWRGHSLRVYLGDSSWPRQDFRLQVDAINEGVSQSGAAGLEFQFYDRMGLLGTPLQVNRVAGELVPICLGVVKNCEPLLIDAVGLKYQVNDGEVISIVVRDNGVDITAQCVINLTKGTFSLTVARVGVITCDVVEQHQTLAQIVEFVAARYGVGVNAQNLADFPNTSVMGYFVNGSIDGVRILSDLGAGVGSLVRFSLLSELEIIRLNNQGSVLSVLPDDIAQDGVSLVEVQPPNSVLTMQYRRNWTVQDNNALAGVVSESSRVFYGQELSSLEHSNAVVGAPLAEPLTITSFIDKEADARSELERRAELRLLPRRVWRINAFLSSVGVALGDVVSIHYRDFGFSQGVDGVVISCEKNLLLDAVTFEVLI